MDTTIAETSDWLDGPKVVQWLEEHGLEKPHVQVKRLARRIGDWKNGAAASVYTLDEVCIKLNLHLSDVPAELYLAAKSVNRNKLSPGQREQLRERLRANDPIRAIARDFGCAPSTVRYHLRALQSAA